MLLTIRTTHVPPDELGHLLHKNPSRTQSFSLSFGSAHVFYPELSGEACTAALMLEVDPVALVRGRQGPRDRALDQYVNDRPYVASSFLSVALARVFRSAMAGTSRERSELAATPIPLEATLAVVPCRGGEPFLRRLFEPLGYAVGTTAHPLSPDRPEWGPSQYYTLTLSRICRLSELLTHLYVLVPVLDDQKHYWVGDAEVEKLLRHGGGWLESHPERDLIARRYLRHRRSLVDQAIRRLVAEVESEDDTGQLERDAEEQELERTVSLHERRLQAVAATLQHAGARRVIDLGCGEGKLIRLLLQNRQFEFILGLDVSHRALEIAADRLHLDRMPRLQRERVALVHGSLMYRDQRLEGYDAAAVVEVLEHLDPPRLAAFERVLFEFARPATVVLTTPNAEYNVKWPTLPAGQFRHRDHRFEWTRGEFAAWTGEVTSRFGYRVTLHPVGEEDPAVGPPSQMAVFSR